MEHQSFPLKHFQDFVRERAGLTFTGTREEILSQRVAEVMARKGFKSRSEFFAVIRNNYDEFLDFVNLLTINETYFFREPQYIRLMADHLVPELLAAQGGGTRLKIVSAGCSTGEEPYSIAIALNEKYGDDVCSLFSIIGVDINSVALQRAAEGVYGKISFRDDMGKLRQKYFEEEGNLYKINDRVKKLVSFKRFNLLGNEFAEDLRTADIVFYRNVSIYFDAATQRKILARLASILNDGGVVIFSSSETLSHQDTGLLTLVEKQGLFCYQKQPSSQQSERGSGPDKDGRDVRRKTIASKLRPATREDHNFPGRSAEAVRRVRHGQSKELGTPSKPVGPLDPEQMFARALGFIRRKEASAVKAIAEELKDFDAYVGKAYLLEGCLLLNEKKYTDAEAALMKALQRDELDLDAYMLLGITVRQSGDKDRAIECFMKALYVQHSCWIAQYFLAEIYQERGDNLKALRCYSYVLEILESGPAESGRLEFFPVAFQRQDYMHLCRTKIAALEAWVHGI